MYFRYRLASGKYFDSDKQDDVQHPGQSAEGELLRVKELGDNPLVLQGSHDAEYVALWPSQVEGVSVMDNQHRP